MNDGLISLTLVVILTLISGWADAQGFIYAGRMWQRDHLMLPETIKSAIGFVSGFIAYWLALRYMSKLGIVSAELQTLLWFGITLIGVSVLSGQFLTWAAMDQMIACAVLAGIGWLLIRTGG